MANEGEATTTSEWIDQQIEAAVQRTLADLEAYARDGRGRSVPAEGTQERHMVAFAPALPSSG